MVAQFTVRDNEIPGHLSGRGFSSGNGAAMVRFFYMRGLVSTLAILKKIR